MTTREKMGALVDELRATPLDDVNPDARGLAETFQIASGLGFDPFAGLVPDTDAEADVLIDKLICLLLTLRGDDLPPFDPSRYGEAEEVTP